MDKHHEKEYQVDRHHYYRYSVPVIASLQRQG
jgi:hypothetical protein